MCPSPASPRRGWWAPIALGVVAIALALAAFVVEIPERLWWATTLQLVGALVTLGGFSSAYVRARYGRKLWEQLRLWARQFDGWLRRMWARLRRKSLNQTIYPSSAGTTEGMGTPTVTVSGYLGVDPNAPLKRQVERLVALVNQLSDQLDKLQTEVLRLDQRIDHVVSNATKGLEDAIAQIRGEIEQLTARMDRYQVLDLRWAIAGLAITVVGTALSY